MSKQVSSDARPHLIIMGIRGLPAAHGEFETFAEHLSVYLIARGWRVAVYCQGSPTGQRIVDEWRGVTRIHIPAKGDTVVSSIKFDIKATFDVLNVPGVILTLGYNTAFLCGILAARSRTNIINIDGIEWKRAKYGRGAKVYLWLNERLAAWSGTHLIADHPRIADHIARIVPRGRITVIPYGAPEIRDVDAALLAAYGIEPGKYLTVIARAEPENSILEIVRGFSVQPRGLKLMVLGKYDPQHDYQRQVMASAGEDVIFPGPIYDAATLAALRSYSMACVHGHQVGGTNSSLVEALGAGNVIIARDNHFNRWVAGDAAMYFGTSQDVDAVLDQLIAHPEISAAKRQAAMARFQSEFTWDHINRQYETLLGGFYGDVKS